MNERQPIPLVELVQHYREFKSTRDDGKLVPGRYRGQKARVELATRYIADSTELTNMFFRSVARFGSYSNISESFVGRKRTESAEVADIDEITSGPKAAAFLARKVPDRNLPIEGLGDYAYVDREIVPARTTAGKHATMANHFNDETRSRSTRAMKADLLLRSIPDGRPTIGEVKVSSASGDDADPVYGLIQALALASQLAGEKQRSRLRTHYQGEAFAEAGPIDVLVILFLIAKGKSRKTYRAKLVELARELCVRLDRGALHPHVERVALVKAVPQAQKLRFTA